MTGQTSTVMTTSSSIFSPRYLETNDSQVVSHEAPNTPTNVRQHGRFSSFVVNDVSTLRFIGGVSQCSAEVVFPNMPLRGEATSQRTFVIALTWRHDHLVDPWGPSIQFSQSSEHSDYRLSVKG